ncbi:MAG: hypothetical protein ACW99G_04745 [Candidatus Thorarchaeota archaeon]
MEKRGSKTWLPNRTTLIMVPAMSFGLVLGVWLWLLFLPMPPLWACAISWSIGLPALVLVLARIFIFYVGIGPEEIVFVKLYRLIRINRSEIASIDIAPPVDSSDLEVPFWKIRDRAMTFRLQSGECIEVSPLEGPLAYRVYMDVVGEESISST